MPRLYTLSLSVLAVWRVTHLLQAEDGPGALLARLRALAGAGLWGQLLDCFYCLSLWVAAPFAWFSGGDWTEKLLLWPALSGAAILIERVTARPVIYAEDDPEPNSAEESDELLWNVQESSRRRNRPERGRPTGNNRL